MEVECQCPQSRLTLPETKSLACMQFITDLFLAGRACEGHTNTFAYFTTDLEGKKAGYLEER